MAEKILVLVSMCLCIKLCVSQSFGFPRQRENRHYQSQQFGFRQNYPYYYQNSRENNYPGLGQPQPYNQANQFIQYYDQFGRSIVRPYEENRNRYPQNWEESQGRYAGQGRNEQVYESYRDNVNYNGENVNFPSENNNKYPSQLTLSSHDTYEIYIQESQGVNFPGEVQPNLPAQSPVAIKPAPTLPLLSPVATASEPVFTSTTEVTTLPPLSPVPQSDYNNNDPAFGPIRTTTLTPLTPVPQSNYNNEPAFGPIETTTLPALTPVQQSDYNNNNEPAFGPIRTTTLPPLTPEAQSNYNNEPAFGPIRTTTLPPLTPVPQSDYNNNEPAFGPIRTTTLPPLTPEAQSNYNNEPAFGPIRTTTLPALTPVPQSDYNNNEPAFGPIRTTTLPPLTPEAQSNYNNEPAFGPIRTTTLPPLTPVPQSDYNNNEPAFGPIRTTSLPPLTPVSQSNYNNEPAFGPIRTTTLPPLTPVPLSVSRNNFDFGPSGEFNEPCELEGTRGSCVPLLQCELFANLLTKAQSDPQVVYLLRKAHCGFHGNNPKVCCPSLRIPDQPPPSPTPDPLPIPIEIPTPNPNAADSDGGDYLDALPSPPVCGNSTATLSRVVGGIDARLGDFPWMALLGYKKRDSVGWNCGGSLVSSKHVLTAAHCIHNLEKTLYVVRLGELDLAREDDGATPVDVLIKKMMKHEAYNRTTLSNDIGILLLERHVPFTDLIRPICIPTSRELRANNFENYNPMVAGWGSLEYRGPSATILQVLQLPVVGNNYCSERFKDYKQISIDNRVLCAGYKKGGKDACQGDSGGPLMQPIWNSVDYSTQFYQIGVVSFGKKCAEPGFPGVYTRVTTFVPWIEEKILGPNAKNI